MPTTLSTKIHLELLENEKTTKEKRMGVLSACGRIQKQLATAELTPDIKKVTCTHCKRSEKGRKLIAKDEDIEPVEHGWTM